MNRYKLTIAYNGKNYSGWQIQDNAYTVEEAVREGLERLFGIDYRLQYSSRTDAGVHALGQVAVIDVDTHIPLWKMPYAINAHLPNDIVIRAVRYAKEDFHPRYHAKNKTYRYLIDNHPYGTPLTRENAYEINQPLDVDAMREAASYFLGEHDFIAFSSKGLSVQTTIRTIYQIDITVQGELIELIVTGNGFLYNMVRIMVGALVQVGLHKYEPSFIGEIIERKERSLVKRVAPAHGLTLMEIVYDDAYM